MLIGQVLRASNFLAVERLVRSSARRALAVSTSFSDDALGYFTERLDPTPTRAALARTLRQAKRNKAFETSGGIGLAVDGTTVGRCATSACLLCRPYRNADQEIVGYRHHLVLISVVGTGLCLPFDVEPYGPGDSEYAAGQRLLRRAKGLMTPRTAMAWDISPNSLLITWLLTSLALTIERLYRLRYLRRGTHSMRTAADFVYVLWLSLSRPAAADTS